MNKDEKNAEHLKLIYDFMELLFVIVGSMGIISFIFGMCVGLLI